MVFSLGSSFYTCALKFPQGCLDGYQVSGVSGAADTLYETTKFTIVANEISPQSSLRTQRAQRLFQILFLSVLSDLCGERLCFFFDQTGYCLGRGLR